MDGGDLPRALRVLIVRELGIWVARGVEVAYVASGQSPEDAMHRFVRELCADVDAERYAMLELPSPRTVWNRLVDAVKDGTVRCSGMFALECRKPPEFPYDMAIFFQIEERPSKRGAGRTARGVQVKHAPRRDARAVRVQAAPARRWGWASAPRRRRRVRVRPAKGARRIS